MLITIITTGVSLTNLRHLLAYYHVIELRWTGLLEEIGERLRSSKALLQLWQRYNELYEQSCNSIQLQEEKADQLLKTTCNKDIADDEVSDWIQECSVSQATALQLATTEKLLSILLLKPHCETHMDMKEKFNILNIPSRVWCSWML